MKRLILLVVALCALSGSVLAQDATPAATPETTVSPDAPVLTVVTHDSFNVGESVLNAFEVSNNIQVRLLKSGDAGTMVNQAVLSKDAPLGDVTFVPAAKLERAQAHRTLGFLAAGVLDRSEVTP